MRASRLAKELRFQRVTKASFETGLPFSGRGRELKFRVGSDTWGVRRDLVRAIG